MRVAKNKKTGNYVAIKVMKKLEIIKSKQTDHILNEVKIIAMIDHPFIVKYIPLILRLVLTVLLKMIEAYIYR